MDAKGEMIQPRVRLSVSKDIKEGGRDYVDLIAVSNSGFW